MKARIKLTSESDRTVKLRSPYFAYKDVYLFDPASKRKYLLMKDGDGLFQVTPFGQSIDGGTFLPDWSKTILMSLTFPAPPDDVTTVDLVLPDFLPFEAVPVEGLGGAAAGGIATAGRSLGLEAALAELNAEVAQDEISIDVAADVLFDFDRSELKPAAEEKLGQLLTIVKSSPTATVSIEGHTDVRGDADYNQGLSLRRAESVRDWLRRHGIGADRLVATGGGESSPLRTGMTEADHLANRRVEIRIRGA